MGQLASCQGSDSSSCWVIWGLDYQKKKKKKLKFGLDQSQLVSKWFFINLKYSPVNLYGPINPPSDWRSLATRGTHGQHTRG